MAQIPFLAWFLQGIPECIMSIFLSTKLLGFKYYEQKRLLVILGIGQAILAFLLRLLPVAYGVHTTILIIFLVIWTYLITKKRLLYCLIAAVSTIIFLVSFESLIFYSVVKILEVKPEIIIFNIWLRIVVGWPQIILLLIAANLADKIYKYKRTKKPVAF